MSVHTCRDTHYCCQQVTRAFETLATGLLTHLAEGLGLPLDTFNFLLNTTAPQHSEAVAASGLETIHYLAPSAPAADESASASCDAHIDKGLLTLIFPDTEQGLYVGTLFLQAQTYMHKLGVCWPLGFHKS